MSTARINFTADTRNFQQGINGIQKSIGGLRVTVGAVATAFAAIGISNVASGLGGLVTSSSQAAASFETLAVQMEVLLGSADKAKELVAQMKEFGATTPLEQKDIQQATKTLLQFGIKGEDVMGILKMLGDTSMGNADKLQTLSRAFGQMSSSGKSSMEDINMMIDAGFNPLNVIAARTGESMGSLRQRVSDGNVGIKEITKAFEDATGKGGTFNNMLGRISETTEGKLSNLSDAVHALKVAFGTGLNVGLRDVLDKLNTLTPTFTAQVTSLGEAAGKLLIVLAEKLPESVSQIENYITKSGGIMNALKAGIVNVLQDGSVKSAVAELGRLMIPKEVREGAIGQLGKTFASGTTELSGGLLAAGLLGGKSLVGKVATGLGLTMTGKTAMDKGDETGFAGTMAGLGIMQLVSLLMNKGIKAAATTTAAAGGSILQNQAIGNILMRLGILAQTPIGAGALIGTGIGIGAEEMGLLNFLPGGKISEEGKSVLNKFEDFEPIKGFKEEIAAEMTPVIPFTETLGVGETVKMGAEKWKSSIQKGLNDIKFDKYFANLAKVHSDVMEQLKWQPSSDMAGIPMFAQFEDILSYEPKTDEMKGLSVSAAKPFITSLAAVGGGKFFTGKDTMASLQQTTNKFLAKIERNTKNIKATAAWS